MQKKLRKVVRPFARKHRGGWIIQPEELVKHLRNSDAVEVGKIQVGAKTLVRVINLMQFPDHELLIKANGKLEFENIARVYASKDGVRQCNFKLPRNRHHFSVFHGAWMPKEVKSLAVLKPLRYK